MGFFVLWTLKSVWGFIYSSASIATLIGAGAVAIAVLEPSFLDKITDLRKWAIAVAVVAFSYSSIAGKFYADGLREKQAEWNAALAREITDGEKARADALAHDPPATDRRVYDHDPRNRDRGKNTTK
jgi:hypothetical protein